MSEFDQIVRNRENATASRRSEREREANASGQAREDARWAELVALVPTALRVLKESPDEWKTVRAPRKTWLGATKMQLIAGYRVHGWRELGKGQSSVTEERLRDPAAVFLLSDGRLADTAGEMARQDPIEVRPLDERSLSRVPFKAVRGRLETIAMASGLSQSRSS